MSDEQVDTQEREASDQDRAKSVRTPAWLDALAISYKLVAQGSVIIIAAFAVWGAANFAGSSYDTILRIFALVLWAGIGILTIHVGISLMSYQQTGELDSYIAEAYTGTWFGRVLRTWWVRRSS